MKTVLKIAFITSMCIGLAACGSDEKKVIEPDIVGKADFATMVDMKGRLDFGTEVNDSFTTDLEFHAYTVYAAAGSVIKLEVTHAGTARVLDTTLFVYGPEISISNLGDRIAHDDDSGWGAHSKLDNLLLAQMGFYTVVVGTADGMGRGHYRLTLQCLSAECVPDDTPVVLTEVEIPDALEDLLADAEMPSYAYAHVTAFEWSGYHETPGFEQIWDPLEEWWLEHYEWEDDELPWEDEDEISKYVFEEDLEAYGIDDVEFRTASGIGYDYRVMRTNYDFTCYSGVTCWESLYAIISYETNAIYVLTLGAGEE
jgi:hypothetical protein